MGDNGGDAAKRHRHLPPSGDSLLHSQPLPLLPDELIFDILLLLPVRSLLEFKRICKSWKTLISSPEFTNNHHQNLTLNPTITNQRLFFCLVNQKWKTHAMNQTYKIASFPMKSLLENPSEPTEPPVEFTMKHDFRILGSCNGLLCLYDIDEGYVKLWNPCIGFESKKSPTLDYFNKRHTRSRIMGYSGFGYDHVNDKYMVLVSKHCTTARRAYIIEYVTQIYTFGKKRWKTIPNFPCTTNGLVGKFVGGTLNWLVFKKGVTSTSHESVILSFHLRKQTYKELFLPENDGVKACNHMLGVMNSCLCVCFCDIETRWNLWVMKKFGVAESWTRLTVMPYEQLHNRVQHRLGFIKSVLFLENNLVLLSIINKFVLLNLDNGRLDEYNLGSSLIESRLHIYCESLVSPQL